MRKSGPASEDVQRRQVGIGRNASSHRARDETGQSRRCDPGIAAPEAAPEGSAERLRVRARLRRAVLRASCSRPPDRWHTRSSRAESVARRTGPRPRTFRTWRRPVTSMFRPRTASENSRPSSRCPSNRRRRPREGIGEIPGCRERPHIVGHGRRSAAVENDVGRRLQGPAAPRDGDPNFSKPQELVVVFGVTDGHGITRRKS